MDWEQVAESLSNQAKRHSSHADSYANQELRNQHRISAHICLDLALAIQSGYISHRIKEQTNG